MGVKVKETCMKEHQQGMPMKELVQKLNPMVRGWVNYFKAGNSARKFTELDRYVKVRLKAVWCRRHQRRTWPPTVYRSLGVYQATTEKVYV